MASCYLGDHIARDYTHYSKKNLRNYNRSTALERSVIENGGGGGGGDICFCPNEGFLTH